MFNNEAFTGLEFFGNSIGNRSTSAKYHKRINLCMAWGKREIRASETNNYKHVSPAKTAVLLRFHQIGKYNLVSIYTL